MLKPRLESSVKLIHGRVLLNDKDKYTSGFSMFIMGRTANIWGLNGIGFFRAIPSLIEDLFFTHGLKYITFEMMADTLSQLQNAIGAQCEFVETDRFIMDGKREVIVVRINLKGEQTGIQDATQPPLSAS